MRTFENPANGYKEEVGSGAIWGVLLFGALFLAAKGLWRHVFLWLVLVIPLSALTGGPGLIFFAPLASIIYAFAIQNILANDLLSKGWKETTKQPVMVFDETSGGYREVVTPAIPETKKCPYCAEEVKYEAIKCKHCQSDLSQARQS